MFAEDASGYFNSGRSTLKLSNEGRPADASRLKRLVGASAPLAGNVLSHCLQPRELTINFREPRWKIEKGGHVD